MQKMKHFMVRGGVVLGSLGLLAGQAMAEVPAEATASLTEAKADGVAIGGVVLGVIIAIAAFKYIRRAL
ncbi:major capsid protein [Pseudomonas aeruginosa]|uniref:major capsid protein n=1 Tax=Pseudomonas aeruginosa TaxID=287 RepID=UPI0021E1B2D9|nr:major capsid protein [Pseudomonas aeruginosa]MCZ9718549.1 major capsid protein [Pseudomonas aeruginosa]MDG3977696.1 major capsid protein [Pseudomonas aeruginosa]GLE98607.1 hypothetical protein VNPA120840_54610 [Pseudomonas aeruginosa]GLE98620.1 hypothetical protein VNPA120840_54740 [Pseudomonas aeruginosa]GLF04761.1 hypothetical protein VNPA120889_49180 [Pseudomonas aeruginosa]